MTENRGAFPPGDEDFTRQTMAGWRWSLPVLTMLVIAFFGRFLFSGRFFLLRDLIFDFFARFEFYKSYLLRGVMPLWNPYTGWGEPFLANMESAVFYPPNLLYLLLPVPIANVVLVTLHVTLAGFGVWMACRSWRVSAHGALFAAIAFAFSTQTITRIEFYSFLCSYSWYPLLVGLFTLWLRDQTLRKFLLLAIGLSLQFLGGYPEASFFTGMTLTIYILYWAVMKWKNGDCQWQVIAWPILGFVGTAIVAMGISAVQILPVLDVMPHTLRSTFDLQDADVASVNPLMLFTAIFPYLYGTAGYYGKYWAPSCSEFWQGTFYVGVVPIILCLTVLWHRIMGDGRVSVVRDDDFITSIRTPLLCLILVFFLLYAMGVYTPFYGVLWKVFPPVRWFRWPAKSLMVVTFALSCLAGIALDWLTAERKPISESLGLWRRRLVTWFPLSFWLLIALFTGGCLVGNGEFGKWLLRRFFILGRVQNEYTQRIPWELISEHALFFIFILVVSGFLLQLLLTRGGPWRRISLWAFPLILFLDLLWTTYPLLPSSDLDIMHNRGSHIATLTSGRENKGFYRPFSQLYLYGIRDEKILRLARNTIAGSWAMVDRVYNVRPMGDFKLRNYTDLLIPYDFSEVPEQYRGNFEQILGITHRFDLEVTPGYFKDGYLTVPKIKRVGSPMVSAMVVGGVMVVPARKALLYQLVGEIDARPTRALVESGQLIDQELIGREGKVVHRLIRYQEGDNRLTIEVESERKGVLVTQGTYYPGWEATVNGISTPVFLADAAFRAVVVPAGHSLVEMKFHPSSLKKGLAVTLGSLMLVLALFFWRGRRESREWKV